MAAVGSLAPASAPAAPSAATPPTKTLTVKITSGPEGTVNTPDVSFSFSVEGTEEAGTYFHCGLDTLALKDCPSPFTAGPLSPGPHTLYVEATNEAANAYSAILSRTFTVGASTGGSGGATSGGGTSTGGGSSGGTGGGSPKRAPVAPTVSALTQSSARWREGSAPARISRAAAGAPRGTTFSFALNEAAAAHLSFTQAISGRSVGGRCVAQTRANRSRRACRRTIVAGALTLQGHAGSDRVRFEGRLSAAKRLKPGRYTLILSATAGGLTSAPRSLTFTIVS